MEHNSVRTFIGLPATSITGYVRKLMGPALVAKRAGMPASRAQGGEISVKIATVAALHADYDLSVM
jgi:hypothetical protein